MRNITHQDVLGLPFPTGLDLTEQQAAVAHLDEVSARVADLRASQQSAATDLAALMPALLDRAFEGELRT
jgi:hypothetical protein